MFPLPHGAVYPCAFIWRELPSFRAVCLLLNIAELNGTPVVELTFKF